jgi:heme exporter protein C
MWTWFYQFAVPKLFYQRSRVLQRCLSVSALLLLSMGLVAGLFIAPADYQQGDAVRIMYIHVPAAFCSLGVYGFMAVNALMFLIWRIKINDILLQVAAPVGASLTALALLTGSLWGMPTWGTWWIWDARLTSELILLFIYFGVIGMRHALPRATASSAVAILTLLGFIDIPLIHYSVNWWYTLHQGASLSAFAKPHIADSLLWPLLLMIAGTACFTGREIISRARSELLCRETQQLWVKQVKVTQ